MNRRKFLIAVSGIGVASAISDGFYLASDTTTLETWIENVVVEHLASGSMVGTDIKVFAHDYLTNNARLANLALLRAYAALPQSIESRLHLLSKNPEKHIQEIKRGIITTYLLNSDLFHTEKATSGTVKYLAYNQSICATANPFARFLY